MDFIFVGAGNAWEYIKADWKSNRVRFCAEVFAWACSVISAVIFAVTVPNIPVVPLYFAKPRPVVKRGETLVMVDDDRLPLERSEVPQIKNVRFRTLGCYPLTGAIESTAASVEDIIRETLDSRFSERRDRVIDQDGSSSMERKKQEGYF